MEAVVETQQRLIRDGSANLEEMRLNLIWVQTMLAIMKTSDPVESATTKPLAEAETAGETADPTMVGTGKEKNT